MSAAERLGYIEGRLDHSGYHPAKDDSFALVAALRAVLDLVQPRHDNIYTDGPSYVETWLIRQAIEENL